MNNRSITKIYTLKNETVYKNVHVNAVDVYIYYTNGNDYNLKRGYYLSINPSLHNGYIVQIHPLDGVLIHIQDANRFSRKRLEELANEEVMIHEKVYHYFPEFVGILTDPEVKN